MEFEKPWSLSLDRPKKGTDQQALKIKPIIYLTGLYLF
jgi:hypothetical protein